MQNQFQGVYKGSGWFRRVVGIQKCLVDVTGVALSQKISIRFIKKILHQYDMVNIPYVYRVLYIQKVVGLGISEPSTAIT